MASSPSIYEFRVVLPMTVEEYQVAQLWSTAEASKNETGGGEGIEVLNNEPFDFDENKNFYKDLKDSSGQAVKKGQYTKKIYHLESRVPKIVKALAPKGSLKFHEDAWNAYPFCRTEVTNPDYMKDGFYIVIQTMHVDNDRGQLENAHNLPPADLAERVVKYIDIANDKIKDSDYKEEWDPTKFHSEKSGRGPLGGTWRDNVTPVMCAYKLVLCKFKWFGLQTRVQNFIQKQEERIFRNFHRQVFCWMDNWYGLTMVDIRRIEEKTKKDLDEQRKQGAIRGTVGSDDA